MSLKAIELLKVRLDALRKKYIENDIKVKQAEDAAMRASETAFIAETVSKYGSLSVLFRLLASLMKQLEGSNESVYKSSPVHCFTRYASFGQMVKSRDISYCNYKKGLIE